VGLVRGRPESFNLLALFHSIEKECAHAFSYDTY
jgi:hypothetical protein